MTTIQPQPTIALASIVVSKTNPRKTFDKAKLEELTGSVKLQGILQPILVRPINGDGTFEVVAGERRFKAAKAAGLTEIPATVRELTDAQTLELQVIENNQREDLHPLEEAEGYEALLKCKHPDGTKYSVADIAKKVGKSTAYVYQKLKLCACCPEVRNAFYDGKIDFSKALLLARIHGPMLQSQALKQITAPHYGNEPMSFRSAQNYVHQNYMLALDKAPFSTKDEKLVPKAGPCTTCPKRTGNAPELFADVKSGDVCTDPACFKLKRIAAVDVRKAAAIAAGQTVISGKAAKQVKPSEYRINDEYVSASDHCYDDPKQRTYAQIIGSAMKPLLLDDPHKEGELVEIFRREDIKPILKEKGAVRQSPRNKAKSKGRGAAAKSAPEKPNTDAAFRKRLFLELCAKLPTALGKEELTTIAKTSLDMGDIAAEDVADALIPQKGGEKYVSYQAAYAAIEKAIPKLDVEGLTRLVIALLLAEDIGIFYGKPERMLDAAKRWKVDAEKIKKTVEAEIKAAREQEKAAAKAAAPKKQSKGAAALAKTKKKSTKK